MVGGFDVTQAGKMTKDGAGISETSRPRRRKSALDSYLCCYSQPAARFIDPGRQQWDRILVQQRQ